MAQAAKIGPAAQTAPSVPAAQSFSEGAVQSAMGQAAEAANAKSAMINPRFVGCRWTNNTSNNS
jgi:hypothetical protein